MLYYYPAVIEKEPDSDFGVSSPNFPGCVSSDATLTEALAGAREALALHLQDMIADRELLPNPAAPEPDALGTLDFVGRAKFYKLFTLVPVQVPGRALRVNVTLDEALLAEIDSKARNRSAFLEVAARALLTRLRR